MMIPITRKEKYINEIVGGGNTAPETPQTREELFFADILGEVVAPSPITREEMFWADYALIVEKEISGIPPLTFNAIAGTLNNYRIYGNTENKTRSYSGSAPLSFPITDGAVSNYRVYGNTVNGESVGDLVTDSQSEHYGEYAIPITNNSEIANIYLNEPLRKVGDEAEYVDYAEQKWRRVRKNLLQNTVTSQTKKGITFTVNTDGSITCSGILTSGEYADLVISGVFLGDIDILENGNYVVSCTNANNNNSLIVGNSEGEVGRVKAAEININANLTWVMLRIKQANPAITLYPMIRKADITDDTYEPYIENTEVDVTLPEIAVTAGTNTLTVGTEVQPSNVYIKYEGAR